MEPWQVLVLLVFALGIAFAAQAVGRRKGRAGLGWCLGFFLGVIGLAIIALVPKTEAAKVRDAAERMRIEQAAREQLGRP